jgi:hypothetical protein
VLLASAPNAFSVFHIFLSPHAYQREDCPVDTFPSKPPSTIESLLAGLGEAERCDDLISA